MGADLYLESRWAPLYEPIMKKMKKAAGPREFYKAARATGFYYRNGYNASDVMWAMGLSWWGTVLPMLDAAGRLPIARARELVAMIEARPLNKETFGRHYLDLVSGTPNPIIVPTIRSMEAESGEPVEFPPAPPFAELLSILQKRRDELLALLRKSIDLNEPLVCSL